MIKSGNARRVFGSHSAAVAGGGGSSTFTDTWNPSDKDVDISLSGGNLTATSANDGGVRSVNSRSAGKYYFEVTVNSIASTFTAIGMGKATAAITGSPGDDANGWSYLNDGRSYHSGSLSAYGASYVAPNVIGVAVDIDAGKMWFSKSGVYQGGGNPAAGTGAVFTDIAGPIFPMVGDPNVGGGDSWTANFGATAFATAPPAGFTAWNG